MIDISAIDSHLGEQGQFNLLDWLLAHNFLAYSDYEKWRYGEYSPLSQAITCDRQQLLALVKTSQKLCKKLKLCEENQPYFAWNSEHKKHLKIDKDAMVQEAFCTRWLRAQDVPQLDLFMDNSAIVTENALCDALTNRSFSEAAQHITELTALNPNNSKLGGFQSLLVYGQHITQNTFITQDATQQELDGLENEVIPLAQSLLQRGARDYLAVAWQRLAEHFKDQPYNEATPKHHASYAYSHIPDWKHVAHILINDPLTYQHQALLARLAASFYHINDHAKARFCWVLAFERFPQQAEQMLEDAKPPYIYERWESFQEANEGWPDVFFAGFILATEPSLIFQTEYFPSFSQSTTQLVASLMEKKLNHDDEIQARQQIQNYSSALLRMVMSA